MGFDPENLAQQWTEATKVGFGVKATHRDAMKALETVTKMQGLLNDRTEHFRFSISAKAKQMPRPELLKEIQQAQDFTNKIDSE